MNIIYKPKSITIMKKVVMTDGLLIVDDLTYKARSGGWGKGTMPHGKYELVNAHKREDVPDNKAFKLEGYPWGIGLVPLFNTDRTELMIHADGGKYEGTLGCLGIYENDINCFEILSQLMKKEKVFLYVL